MKSHYATISTRQSRRYDLKVHLVWCPKYRKRVLTGPVATRVRDFLRQIAAENELHIISGKVAADHVHMFISYRAYQNISQIVQWLKARTSYPTACAVQRSRSCVYTTAPAAGRNGCSSQRRDIIERWKRRTPYSPTLSKRFATASTMKWSMTR
jgi:REP element-mobilizing transposase RayT